MTAPSDPLPSHATEPQILLLPKLISDVRNSFVALPRFQRPFVWADEQRLNLMRSVFEGAPIGAFLQWRTSMTLARHAWLGPHRLKDPPKGAIFYYLLDGQQRLATLFGALQRLEEGAVDPRPNDDEGGFVLPAEAKLSTPRWDIHFDLKERDFFIPPDKAEDIEPWQIALNKLFVNRDLRTFQRDLTDAARRGWKKKADAPSLFPEHSDSKGSDDALEPMLELLDTLASRFATYPVIISPFVTDSLETAVKTFERINRQGTPMDEVHIVHALTWTQNFDFDALLQRARERHVPPHWQSISDKVLLQACKAAAGLEVVQSPPSFTALTEKLKGRDDLVDQSVNHIAKAIDFLERDCGVVSPALLPYQVQLVLLAEAMREGFQAQDADVAAEVRRWFFWTTVAEYFAGLKSTNWSRARAHLIDLVRGVERPQLAKDLPEQIRPFGAFNVTAARSRGLVLAWLQRDNRAEIVTGQAGPGSWRSLFQVEGAGAFRKLIRPGDLPKGKSGASVDTNGIENRFACTGNAEAQLRKRLLEPSAEPIGPEAMAAHCLTPEIVGLLRSKDPNQWARALTLRRGLWDEFDRSTLQTLRLLRVDDAIQGDGLRGPARSAAR